MSPGTSAGGDEGGVEGDGSAAEGDGSAAASDGSATANDGSATASDGSAAEGEDAGRTRVDPAAGRRASLLWGLVGVLAFLVLVQGFELLGGESVTVAVKAGVAVAVGVAAAMSSYLFGAWLAARREG